MIGWLGTDCMYRKQTETLISLRTTTQDTLAVSDWYHWFNREMVNHSLIFNHFLASWLQTAEAKFYRPDALPTNSVKTLKISSLSRPTSFLSARKKMININLKLYTNNLAASEMQHKLLWHMNSFNVCRSTIKCAKLHIYVHINYLIRLCLFITLNCKLNHPETANLCRGRWSSKFLQFLSAGKNSVKKFLIRCWSG